MSGSGAIELILHAGRGAVEVALYTLLPITIIMTILLRFLEAYGVAAKIVSLFGPLLKPFGLTGLSGVALLQTGLVSFAAPLPTLMRMEHRGLPDREIAATLAAVLTIAPANALFPMAAYGVNTSQNLLVSIVCALGASSCCYYGFGRRLEGGHDVQDTYPQEAAVKASVLKIIEAGGTEAVETVLRLMPILVLSLVIISGIQASGMFNAIQIAMQPLLKLAGISPDMIVPSMVGYLAGGTALVGYYEKAGQAALVSSPIVSDPAMAFLVHNVNLVTISILLSTGPKIARSTPPALAAALVGIALRVGISVVA